MNSIAPLSQVLKPLLKPADEVATYHYYYQDLPVYLHRRITIVNWQNELAFGIAHQDTHQWILDEVTFWNLWSSPKTMLYDYYTKNLPYTINWEHMSFTFNRQNEA